MNNLSTLILRILPKFYPNFNYYLQERLKHVLTLERENEFNMQYTEVTFFRYDETCIYDVYFIRIDSN